MAATPAAAAPAANASLWNPATAATMAAAVATGNTGAATGAAVDAATQLWQIGTARFIPGLESTMLSLRYYFAVDNRYVVLKMKKLFLPFLYKDWKRLVRIMSYGSKYVGV